MSYDATLAFFSVAEGHPAIRGAALLYPFWCGRTADSQRFCTDQLAFIACCYLWLGVSPDCRPLMAGDHGPILHR